MTQQNSHANCVVLRQGAGELPVELRRALDARHSRTEVFNDPFRAFARLCLIERLESLRSGWGLERSSPLSLVINGDFSPASITQLINARDQYIPTIGIEQWREGDMIEIRPALMPAVQSAPSLRTHQAVTQARSAPAAQPNNARNAGPRLHLVEPPEGEFRIRQQSHQSQDHDGDNGQEQSHGNAQSLSPDEVQMLLGNRQDDSNT